MSSLGRGHFFARAFLKSSSMTAFHQSLPCQMAYLPRMPRRSAPPNWQFLKLERFNRALRRSAPRKSELSNADFIRSASTMDARRKSQDVKSPSVRSARSKMVRRKLEPLCVPCGDGFGVVLERVIDHHGFVGRRFVVSRSPCPPPDMTSTPQALERLSVCLAFGCKDCESVFVVFSVGDHQEISFLQSVEVQGKVWRVNACIGEQFVLRESTVFNPFDVSEVVDGSKHLVWLSRKCTVFEEGSEGGTTFGQAGFSCSHNGGFHGRFTGLTDAFEQHRPCVPASCVSCSSICMAAPPKSISTSPACIVSQCPRPQTPTASIHS